MNKLAMIVPVRFRTLLGIAALALPAALLVPAAAEPLEKAQRGDWPMWGGSADRNMVSGEKNIPTEWSVKDKKNIKWTAPLGSQTYGTPVVAGGRIFVGTNNNGHLRKGIEGDKGVIICVDEKTGKFLWQITHDKLPTGRVNDWPDQGICSMPIVEGDRMYYVSNRCELVCADVKGLADGNEGPYTDEQYKEKEDGDFIWIYDMIEELGVFPHNLATSSPVIWGDLVFAHTSNGVDEGHLNLPVPDAPSFIAVHKHTGKLVWESSLPAGKVLHGQWSSPTIIQVAGKAQVLFPGGDGWLYALEPETGKLVWKFDLNPKESEWKLGGRGTRNNIIATPVAHDGKVYLGVGQDPEHGEGPGHFYCIDATKEGDVTESGKIWHIGGEDFHRSISTAAVADGLVYIADLSGFLYCLDAATGKRHWKHDTYAAIWGSPYVVDGKVMLGDEEGEVLVAAHGKEFKELATNDMQNAVYTTPVAANGVLYITNRNTLFAIAAGAGAPSSATPATETPAAEPEKNSP
jgi:outer membrane protein assembly factor BamB